METLLGLLIIAGQILWTVIVFGVNLGKGWRISAWICMILFFIAMIWLTK